MHMHVMFALLSCMSWIADFDKLESKFHGSEYTKGVTFGNSVGNVVVHEETGSSGKIFALILVEKERMLPLRRKSRWK